VWSPLFDETGASNAVIVSYVDAVACSRGPIVRTGYFGWDACPGHLRRIDAQTAPLVVASRWNEGEL